MSRVKLKNPFKYDTRTKEYFDLHESRKMFTFGKYSIWNDVNSYLYVYNGLVFNQLVGYNEQYLKEVALRKRTDKNWFLYDRAIEVINKHFKSNFSLWLKKLNVI